MCLSTCFTTPLVASAVLDIAPHNSTVLPASSSRSLQVLLPHFRFNTSSPAAGHTSGLYTCFAFPCTASHLRFLETFYGLLLVCFRLVDPYFPRRISVLKTHAHTLHTFQTSTPLSSVLFLCHPLNSIIFIIKLRLSTFIYTTSKVSWMRKRDLHILTSNIFTYTGDARFSVVHPDPSDDWNLRIEYVQKRDSGIYECQVNTEPKINMAIQLNVDAAQASIWGPEDVYVKKGSTISLTCSVNVHSSPPGSVLWYHGASVVDFDSPRGGISLETEKTASGTTSKLLVTKASLSDSGNYTCVPSNANPASVYVHVLNAGEYPAAMQHGEHGACPTITPTLLLIVLSALALAR
ncbi:transmembrane and immunoglobulin domain-containing protein 1-like isoform X5 [Rhodnius prolixus]